MKIIWTQLPTKGLDGNLQQGVSAAYSAFVDGKLIVAGGANFPGKLGYEGGSKAFYDEVILFDSEQNTWNIVGHLPQPLAYGISIPVSDGALWIGGNTTTASMSSCYKVSMPEESIHLNTFPSFPVTIDNSAGCAIDDIVFVAGGNMNNKPSNGFYCINTKTDSEWTVLPDFPGLPRVQPVMTAIEVDGKPYVYLLGGFFGGDEEREPAMATSILRFDLLAGTWEKVGEQMDPETGKPFSLGGATVMPVNNRYILCLGGVNHDIFLNAITTQYKIGYDLTLSDEEKKQQNQVFSTSYMTQPIEYYRFNPECRIFDTITGEWSTIDYTPNTARAGATLVWDGPVFYAVQGELKPGVRSPETWKGEIMIR